MTPSVLSDLDARVAEIAKRHAATTPGPWSTERPKADPSLHGFSSGVIVAATAPKQGIYANPPGGSFPAADRDFIAHSWADVPYLLTVIAAMRGALEPFAKAADDFDGMPDGRCVLKHKAGQAAPAHIMVGDLRRAAAILRGAKGDGK